MTPIHITELEFGCGTILDTARYGFVVVEHVDRSKGTTQLLVRAVIRGHRHTLYLHEIRGVMIPVQQVDKDTLMQSKQLWTPPPPEDPPEPVVVEKVVQVEKPIDPGYKIVRVNKPHEPKPATAKPKPRKRHDHTPKLEPPCVTPLDSSSSPST